MNYRPNIIGVCRVRNAESVIKHVLDHLQDKLDFVIFLDDCSTDQTKNILKSHPLTKKVLSSEFWESDPHKRALAEGLHRQLLFDEALEYKPNWIYVFDADEFIEFEIGLNDLDKTYDAYYFRLFDFYITSQDVNSHFLDRSYIGPEYRDIPMLFNAQYRFDFKARAPRGIKNSQFGGFVKHYGKAISVKEWNKKCLYYINHLHEIQPGNSTISDKWKKRLGKAVHVNSDFNRQLIKWEEKTIEGVELTISLERHSTKKYKILVATDRLTSIGGSETFTYTLLEELISYKNYTIEYFTFKKGFMAAKIENNLKVPFFTNSHYDLIFANHNTCVNFLSGKGFIIQTCHGIYPKLEQPNKSADAFVAISQEVQNHLTLKGLPSKIILNGINLKRFRSNEPINRNLTSVLSLCQSRDANSIIKACCKKMGLSYKEAYKYEAPIWDVEHLINQSDLVIGLGRSAYEAMSCGRPVIIFDKRDYFDEGADGYVRDNLGFSIRNNCSGRYLKKKFCERTLLEEFKKYNSEDSNYFRNFAEKELDIHKVLLSYLDYFESISQLKKQNNLHSKLRKRIRNYTPKKIKKIIKYFFKKK